MKEISISTDYLKSTGTVEPYLKKISEAGFTHVHWCQEWNTDYIYSESEINKIIKWLEKYNLKVLDLHASEGKENPWYSENESSRIEGIKLVKNRIYMANKLSCNVIVLHFMQEPTNESEKQRYWDILYKSLNELKPYAKKYNVKIALENSIIGNYKELKKLFSKYDSNFLGLCYDSGHGNIENGINALKELKHRLISIHLHDNDGKTDQHKLLFSGTVDWNELAKILVKSSYKKCISMESSMRNYGNLDETIFLSKAYKIGLKFSKLLETYSNNSKNNQLG
jgi:sugar phosphate isomerase/epimerase